MIVANPNVQCCESNRQNSAEDHPDVGTHKRQGDKDKKDTAAHVRDKSRPEEKHLHGFLDCSADQQASEDDRPDDLHKEETLTGAIEASFGIVDHKSECQGQEQEY